MARKLKEAPEQQAVIQPQSDSSAMTQAEQTLDQASFGSRCGAILRTEREKQSLSVQEIASRLRLSPKQIEAIEANNFTVLPEPTIVRGFIRNYAKQLKIDVAPILAGYSIIVPSITPHELVVKPSSNMTVSSYDKANAGRYIFAAILLLLGVGAWLFYQHYIEKPNTTKPSVTAEEFKPINSGSESESTTDAAAPVELPQAALPAAERQDASAESVVPTVPPAIDANAVPPVATATPVIVPVPQIAESVTQPTLAAPTVSALSAAPALQTSDALGLSPDVAIMPSNGKKRLEINATQETWVNITNASGREIYSKIIFAGSRETIEAKPPLNIVVGNAGGTTLIVNGKPIDLAPHTRVNVARVKLDQ